MPSFVPSPKPYGNPAVGGVEDDAGDDVCDASTEAAPRHGPARAVKNEGEEQQPWMSSVHDVHPFRIPRKSFGLSRCGKLGSLGSLFCAAVCLLLAGALWARSGANEWPPPPASPEPVPEPELEGKGTELAPEAALTTTGSRSQRGNIPVDHDATLGDAQNAWLMEHCADFVARAPPSKARLPDFYILGTQKGGTTALERVLVRHPDVYIPRAEQHFFDKPENMARGLAWYSRQLISPPYRGERLLGDKTPHYMFSAAAARAVAQATPGAKLIMLLREPIRRAYSAFRMRVEFGLEKRSFLRAVEDELATMRDMQRAGEVVGLASGRTFVDDGATFYLQRGFYRVQIDAWMKHFSRCQLHVAVSERMVASARKENYKVFKFLGLDVGPGSNVSVSLDLAVVNKRGSRVVLPARSHNHSHSHGQGEKSENEDADDDEDEWAWDSSPVRAVRKKLYEEVFRHENERLFEFLGKRVEEWSSSLE